ncbi:hypothetical protein GCM10023187_25090 [Nibrella viscosa]|uniref:Uncharacterized protein n=1 Tax=Nibrella viscosa TaxID=1084524 RepID=A0ABP8KFP6_9BACT
MLTILFPIVAFYPSQSGGPANTVYWLTKALVNKGYKPCIVTTDMGIPPGTVPLDRWLQTDAGSVMYTNESAYQFYRGTSNVYLFTPKLFLRALTRLPNADIIHLSSFFHIPGALIGILAGLSGKRVFWSVRGEFDPGALSFSQRKKRMVIGLVKHLGLASRVIFHATSNLEKAYVQDVFGKKVTVITIPNYMEMPALKPRNPATPYLLFIGRMHPIKGLDRLIQALDKSGTFRSSGFTLKIAGSFNAYTNEIKQQISELRLADQVEFLGQIEGEAKQQLYADAFVTLLPSHTENFGNVVIESLAQATPVIASTGTPWQLLAEEKAGCWVRNTPEELAKAIDALVAMPEADYQAMRQRARALVENQFDIAKNIDKWIACYRKADEVR